MVDKKRLKVAPRLEEWAEQFTQEDAAELATQGGLNGKAHQHFVDNMKALRFRVASEVFVTRGEGKCAHAVADWWLSGRLGYLASDAIREFQSMGRDAEEKLQVAMIDLRIPSAKPTPNRFLVVVEVFDREGELEPEPYDMEQSKEFIRKMIDSARAMGWNFRVVE